MSFSYLRSLLASVGLHSGLLIMMFWNPQHPQAVLEANQHSKVAEQTATAAPIQAVAVDVSEVQQVMKKLQAQKDEARRQEISRQNQLNKEAEKAKAAKVAEMKNLQDLKKQADDMRIQQQKMKLEAAAHLKKIEQEKVEQEKQLAVMKLKQAVEVKRLEKLAHDHEEQLLKQQKATAAAKQSQDVANQQRMAGEVDRYKALILNAIRDRWILPENVDPGLSSQFVIRLAPTGSVLDVRLARSSGDSLLDRSAQAAIYKASPLPVPTDVATFNMFREISLTVRPSNARG